MGFRDWVGRSGCSWGCTAPSRPWGQTRMSEPRLPFHRNRNASSLPIKTWKCHKMHPGALEKSRRDEGSSTGDFVPLLLMVTRLDFSVGIKGCAALGTTLLFGLQNVRPQILPIKHVTCEKKCYHTIPDFSGILAQIFQKWSPNPGFPIISHVLLSVHTSLRKAPSTRTACGGTAGAGSVSREDGAEAWSVLDHKQGCNRTSCFPAELHRPSRIGFCS